RGKRSLAAVTTRASRREQEHSDSNQRKTSSGASTQQRRVEREPAVATSAFAAPGPTSHRRSPRQRPITLNGCRRPKLKRVSSFSKRTKQRESIPSTTATVLP